MKHNFLLTTTSLTGSGLSAKRLKNTVRILTLAGAILIASPLETFALLQNPQGIGVSIDTNGATQTVTQPGLKGIVDAQQGSHINAGETLHFNHALQHSATLVRIHDIQPTQIHGTISGNDPTAKIFMINPNGVVFGHGAQVNVGSLIASTANITNDNFMAGRIQHLDQASPNPNAQIIIEEGANITVADGGLAAFVAPSVKNSGLVQAKTGTVELAAGKTATVDLYGDGLINVQVTTPVDQAPVDSTIPLIQQTKEGKIIADGGTVIITTHAAKNIVDQAINIEGTVQAHTATTNKHGEIILIGGPNGQVTVNGTLDASGKDTGQKGGVVHVLGENIKLAKDAKIDVSGDAGGGTALTGGDFWGKAYDPTGANVVETSLNKSKTTFGQEKTRIRYQENGAISNDPQTPLNGYIQKAANVTIDQGATILAPALNKGDGGKIINFATENMNFKGLANASAGPNGGDGGFVEITGQKDLSYREGKAFASGVLAQAGTLFLDAIETVLVSSIQASWSANTNFVFATAAGNSANIDADTGVLTAPFNNNLTATITGAIGVTFDSGDSLTISGFPNTWTVTATTGNITAAGVDLVGTDTALTLNAASGAGGIVLTSGSNFFTNTGAYTAGVGDIAVAGSEVVGLTSLAFSTPGTLVTTGTSRIDGVTITADDVTVSSGTLTWQATTAAVDNFDAFPGTTTILESFSSGGAGALTVSGDFDTGNVTFNDQYTVSTSNWTFVNLTVNAGSPATVTASNIISGTSAIINDALTLFAVQFFQPTASGSGSSTINGIQWFPAGVVPPDVLQLVVNNLFGNAINSWQNQLENNEFQGVELPSNEIFVGSVIGFGPPKITGTGGEAIVIPESIAKAIEDAIRKKDQFALVQALLRLVDSLKSNQNFEQIAGALLKEFADALRQGGVDNSQVQEVLNNVKKFFEDGPLEKIKAFDELKKFFDRNKNKEVLKQALLDLAQEFVQLPPREETGVKVATVAKKASIENVLREADPSRIDLGPETAPAERLSDLTEEELAAIQDDALSGLGGRVTLTAGQRKVVEGGSSGRAATRAVDRAAFAEGDAGVADALPSLANRLLEDGSRYIDSSLPAEGEANDRLTTPEDFGETDAGIAPDPDAAIKRRAQEIFDRIKKDNGFVRIGEKIFDKNTPALLAEIEAALRDGQATNPQLATPASKTETQPTIPLTEGAPTSKTIEEIVTSIPEKEIKSLEERFGLKINSDNLNKANALLQSGKATLRFVTNSGQVEIVDNSGKVLYTEGDLIAPVTPKKPTDKDVENLQELINIVKNKLIDGIDVANGDRIIDFIRDKIRALEKNIAKLGIDDPKHAEIQEQLEKERQKLDDFIRNQPFDRQKIEKEIKELEKKLADIKQALKGLEENKKEIEIFANEIIKQKTELEKENAKGDNKDNDKINKIKNKINELDKKLQNVNLNDKKIADLKFDIEIIEKNIKNKNYIIEILNNKEFDRAKAEKIIADLEKNIENLEQALLNKGLNERGALEVDLAKAKQDLSDQQDKIRAHLAAENGERVEKGDLFLILELLQRRIDVNENLLKELPNSEDREELLNQFTKDQLLLVRIAVLIEKFEKAGQQIPGEKAPPKPEGKEVDVMESQVIKQDNATKKTIIEIARNYNSSQKSAVLAESLNPEIIVNAEKKLLNIIGKIKQYDEINISVIRDVINGVEEEIRQDNELVLLINADKLNPNTDKLTDQQKNILKIILSTYYNLESQKSF